MVLLHGVPVESSFSGSVGLRNDLVSRSLRFFCGLFERRRGWRQWPALMLLVELVLVMSQRQCWLAVRAVDSLAQMSR